MEELSFPSSNPPRDILAIATLKDADVVLLGVHRPLVGTAWLGGPLLEVAQRANQDVCMFHDTGLSGPPRRILLAPGGEHGEAARRLGDRMARDARVTVDVFQAPANGDAVAALVAAASRYDLVLAGVGETWALPMNLFDVREHPLVTALPCSLLAIHGRPAT
jgi:hypothetical protein